MHPFRYKDQGCIDRLIDNGWYGPPEASTFPFAIAQVQSMEPSPHRMFCHAAGISPKDSSPCFSGLPPGPPLPGAEASGGSPEDEAPAKPMTRFLITSGLGGTSA